MSFPRRSSSFRALVSLTTGLGLFVIGCDQGPSGPRNFTILSPGESRVTVLPGESVHFEVLLNVPGLRVEYLVDGEETHEGPTFDFTPILVEHTVQISVIPEGTTAAAEVREFSVGVAVPGNSPPSVTSFLHTPETAEALRDTFMFTLAATDADGVVSRVVLDFGDGTGPRTLTGGGLTGGQAQEEHVYPAQGTYEVRAIVYDDDEVAVAVRDTVVALPPNQLPTGALTVSGNPAGDAPLSVSLRASGSDPDGQIVQWELDTDLGDGFVPIQPNETVQVSYPYREEPYRPVLRLTDDDGDASEIEADEEILVFRQISASQSRVALQGNPTFDGISIAPAIWANGQDAFVVTVDVRDPEGTAVPDAPLSLRALRPELIAPDGRNLGVPITISPSEARTDGQGRATLFVTTNTSTRVEAAPELGFAPFDLEIQADRGHGELVVLDVIEDLNAETVITEKTGTLLIRAANGQAGYCAGELVNITVNVKARGGAPRGGQPAANLYTVLRRGQFSDPAIIPTTPGPGFSSWRTNGQGRIDLQFRPSEADQAKIVVAWVDGQPLSDLKSFNFSPSCP